MLAVFPTCSSGVFPPVSPHLISLLPIFLPPAPCPLQTKQGNRSSFRNQEGRRGSDEVVPGTSVFPSSATRMSGNFWGSIKGAKYHFALEDRTWDYS